MSGTNDNPIQTTDAGIPVESDEHSLTVGAGGPILLQDSYLIEQMANFNRERIPERQPHAKGSGAFGRFEVTNDVSRYTKAAVFQPGATTRLVVRFSTVAGEQGSPDTWRDPRGFSLKFYTSEGNYDMVGNNTPVFFLQDPMKFQHFIRSQKRRADNGLRDQRHAMGLLDVIPGVGAPSDLADGRPRYPENLASHERLFEPYLQVGQPPGSEFWVKYHFKTDQGIDFLTQAEADRLAGADGDYHRRDLYKAIKQGEFPQLEAENADHAVRAGQDLSFQPVRPDQGVAAQRLSADRGWQDDAGPQRHR